MNETKILELEIRDPRPIVDGSEILASFRCQFRGLELRGCSLVRAPNGFVSVWPPRPERKGPREHRVKFIDHTVRDELRDRARAAFEALGHEIEQGPSA